MALEEAGGRAGDIAVTYESLDDSTAQDGKRGHPRPRPRTRARSRSTRGPGGSTSASSTPARHAVSLPILNEAGVAQISTNTAVGLTSDEPGANPGEPDKYYPTGKRTFARIAPKDTIQGAALATLMKEDGCTKVQLLNDKEVYGAGSPKHPVSAEALGLKIAAHQSIDKTAANFRSLAAAGRRRRRLHGLRGHHRQQRRPALQGLRRRRA